MSCVYVLESYRYDKEKRTSYPVYKIGKTSQNTSRGRTNVTTMSPNDITTLAEINTENGKEKDWEKLLHYIYEDNGNRIIKLIDGRGVKSEWFKIVWDDLRTYLDLISKATGIKINYYTKEKNCDCKKNKNSTNIKDTPTSRFREYYDLAKEVLEKKLQTKFKSIKLIENIKSSHTIWVRLNDLYVVRTNHSTMALKNDIKKLKKILID